LRRGETISHAPRAVFRYHATLEETLQISGVAFGGAGVGRLSDGRVAFVPFVIPGERAVVRITKAKKSYVNAELVSLLERSPRRESPACEVFGICGGCAYQHMDYALQLEWKTKQVAEALQRLGGMGDVEVRPTQPSPLPLGYRNRLSVHVSKGQVGFHHRNSHKLVEISQCPLGSESVNRELASFLSNPPSRDGRYTLREPRTSVGFSQVNDGAAEILAAVVREALGTGGITLVDAYCGAGFFAKRLLDIFEFVIGIEWSAAAIRAARDTATERESYRDGEVESHLESVLHGKSGVSLLLDPPAEGLSEPVIEIIRKFTPQIVVYVSCNPATLARDLKRLSGKYDLEYVQPIDMFPQTAEIEAVAKLRLR